VRFACHGGCPKDRFRDTPDGEPGLNYLCPSFKHFFGHTTPAFRRMTQLVRSGRDAEEIMAEVAAEGPARSAE